MQTNKRNHLARLLAAAAASAAVALSAASCTTTPAPDATGKLAVAKPAADSGKSAALTGAAIAAAGPAPAIAWQPWSDDVFQRATKENKLVLLDLGAVWCHWCHVMDETTYVDPAVRRLLAAKYIAVHVDQDARPDLSNRYEDYGWPATIVFDPAGKEIAKRRGYIPPQAMSSMLAAFIDDPTPGPAGGPVAEVKAASVAALPAEAKAAMVKRIRAAYDAKNEGWGEGHKFVDPDVIEYCLMSGEADLKKMATGTLGAMRKLIDPVWGGVYQYSTDGDWDHAHFEKIMSYQADDMRVYAQAYLATGDAAWLQASKDVHKFIKGFLTSLDGTFYVSQDADVVRGKHSEEYFKKSDADRRKEGIPKIDTHVYARENGWAIRGLVALYQATGDEQLLADAKRSADWVIAHRPLDGGGFRHDEKDVAGPYLGDTLAMGRAFLSLYEATGDKAWLKRAADAGTYIAKTFTAADVSGVVTTALTPAGATAPITSGPTAPRPQADENVATARFANLLHAYTGTDAFKTLAETAMKYLAAPEIAAKKGWGVGGILLADAEVGAEPLHVTVIGPKADAKAKALHQTAGTAATSFKRIEWLDKAEGPLVRAEVDFPPVEDPSAFLCVNGACSSPITDPAALKAKLAKSQSTADAAGGR
jgi:uncharacterized protein YyaL (SSP411 family)